MTRPSSSDLCSHITHGRFCAALVWQAQINHSLNTNWQIESSSTSPINLTLHFAKDKMTGR